MNRRMQTAIVTAALAVVYYCAGKFGLSLAVINPSVSPVWPPTGLALAALLIGGYRLWPGIFIGALLVNFTTQGSVATTVGVASGDTLEALAGTWLVNRFAGGLKVFERPQGIFRFVLLAAILSSVISASFGVTSLCLGGYAPWPQYATIWFTWWLGDMVGTLLVAPLLVIWVTNPWPRWKPRHILESIALMLTLVFVGQTVFLLKEPLAAPEQLGYLSIPPLLLAAFRFEGRGAITSAFFMSGMALWGTVHGIGPFATPNRNQSLLLLQIFMGIITLTALVLAAVVSERRKAEQRLQVRDAVSHVLAEAATPAEAMPKILRALCESGGWDVGMFWNVNRPARELFCAEIWHGSSRNKLSKFEAEIRQRTFAPEVGLPGRVWVSGQPAWIPNVRQDSNLPTTAAARKAGLRAAFGFPLKLDHEILGVVTCFSRQIRSPDASTLQMLGVIAAQVGRFIEHKRAEELMHESEMRFRQMAENINEVFWMTDSAKSQVLYVSPAYEEIWGRTCASLYASPQNWVDAIHTEDRERVVAAWARQSSSPYNEAYRIVRSDGSVRWIHDRAYPVRNRSGQVYRIVGVAEDITERQLAETRLTTLAHAVESTDELISITDLENRLTFVNRAFQQAYGYLEEEILGRTPDLFFSSKNSEELVAEILEQTHLGGWRGEVLNRRKDGTEFPVFLSTSQIKNRAGEVVGLMGVARDVTQQKRLEKEILEISTHERQRIGYDLHDGLGQHLAGVAYKAKSFESLLATQSPARAAVQEIVELINDAMRQTRQLARSLDPVEVAANGLITALERLASDTRAALPVDCRFFCRESSLTLPPPISLALFQIAQEAVRNALVHGGAEQINIDLMIDSRQIHLRILDYGKGFELSQKRSKSGMGLRIMRYRAGSIGGVFSISSEPGGNTVVQCSVPLPFRSTG